MKVSIKQYSQTLFELTDGKSEQEVFNIVKSFASLLKKDGQIKNAGKIMEKFEEIYNKKNNIVKAEVVTKYEIRDTKYEEIESYIKTKYKAEKVELTNIIDESIKGGIVVRVGDEILDGSVESQLKKLKNILSK